MVLVDTSCYGLKSMQLMDHANDKSINITWTWKEMQDIFQNHVRPLGDKLRGMLRPDVLLVGAGSHPQIYPCLRQQNQPGKMIPPYTLFRTDPLQICPGAHFYDMPYFVQAPNVSLSISDRKYLASFAGACSEDKNQASGAVLCAEVRYELLFGSE